MVAIGKHKDIFPQQVKGLCIIFVVLIHLPWGEQTDWTGWMWLSIRQVINFAVAVFFFLSAYFTKSYDEIRQRGICTYYKERLIRLLLPYCLWATIYILFIPLLTDGCIQNNWWFLYLTGIGPTYFLLALSQFTLLTPVLQRYKYNRNANYLFWSVTPIYLVFYYIYNFQFGEEFKPEQFFCFPWFASYYIGLKMQNAQTRKAIARISAISITGLLVLTLVLSMVEASLIFKVTNIYSFAISQITVGSISYSIIVIISLCVQWNNNKIISANWLSKIGDYSMGIFLMHPLFNWIYKFIFLHNPYTRGNYGTPIGYMLIHMAILVLSVVTSLVVAKTISKRYPKTIKILGLQ